MSESRRLKRTATTVVVDMQEPLLPTVLESEATTRALRLRRMPRVLSAVAILERCR